MQRMEGKLNDVMGKLGAFNDDARDLDNNMQRMEGKLNDLDKKPQDAKTLDAIKGMLDDTKDLDKLFGKLENEGEDLINDADHLGSDASNIKDTLDSMGDRLNGLRGRLKDKADDLKNAGAALGEFNEFLKELASGIGMLDDELNKMGPILFNSSSNIPMPLANSLRNSLNSPKAAPAFLRSSALSLRRPRSPLSLSPMLSRVSLMLLASEPR